MNLSSHVYSSGFVCRTCCFVLVDAAGYRSPNSRQPFVLMLQHQPLDSGMLFNAHLSHDIFCNPIGGTHISMPYTKIAQEFPDLARKTEVVLGYSQADRLNTFYSSRTKPFNYFSLFLWTLRQTLQLYLCMITHVRCCADKYTVARDTYSSLYLSLLLRISLMKLKTYV